jgi:hypothetical protein
VNWRDIRGFFAGSALHNELPRPPAEPPSDRNELGAAAARLLEDPVFALALDRLQRDLYDTWRQSELGAQERRERAYLLYTAIEDLKAELRRMVTTARLHQ